MSELEDRIMLTVVMVLLSIAVVLVLSVAWALVFHPSVFDDHTTVTIDVPAGRTGR